MCENTAVIQGETENWLVSTRSPFLEITVGQFAEITPSPPSESGSAIGYRSHVEPKKSNQVEFKSKRTEQPGTVHKQNKGVAARKCALARDRDGRVAEEDVGGGVIVLASGGVRWREPAAVGQPRNIIGRHRTLESKYGYTSHIPD